MYVDAVCPMDCYLLVLGIIPLDLVPVLGITAFGEPEGCFPACDFDEANAIDSHNSFFLVLPLFSGDIEKIPDFAEGNVEKKFHISGHYEEFDALIDIPKVKTHSFMLFTGAVKNLFGLISGNDKTKLHLFHPVEQSFATMLLDLYSLVKPKVKLVVMDGIIGMDGHGPTAGDPKEIGYIIAGTDALATDIIMSKVLDIRKDVPYLKIAKRYGMETADIRNITFRNGDIKDYLIKDFRLPKQNPLRLFIPFWLKNSLVHYPKVDAAKCIGCRRCYDGCP